MQNILKVNEIFTSIQGEGFHTGQLATFIRLQGCNLNCFWCDTKDALSKDRGQEMAVDDILEKIPPQFKFVVITGGEPFFQKNLVSLVEALKTRGCYIQIETNGTIFNSLLVGKIDWVTVSPKPPEYKIHLLFYRPFLREIKLIVDKELTKDIIETYLQPGIPVTLQPESNKKEFVNKAMSFMKSMNAPNLKLRLQQHKFMEMR